MEGKSKGDVWKPNASRRKDHRTEHYDRSNEMRTANPPSLFPSGT